MDMRYLEFCREGTPYYAPRQSRSLPMKRFCPELPDDWSTSSSRLWAYQQPAGLILPVQGWKIHVTTELANAGAVLDIVARYCVAHGLAFKYLVDDETLLRQNSKYADRSSSGKFVTIYPPTEAALARSLADLDEQLRGFTGPQVLSDLRYASGPLSVRYGAFVDMTLPGPAGRPIHAIRDPQGTLVPDRRSPGFHVPDWVTVPVCLDESVQARRAATLEGFPYRAQRALHFSNGGGVYEAVDLRTQAKVLLKEARPGAGLDELGRDAVARLDRERWALEKLAGIPGIPRMIDFRQGREHLFLAREFLEGTPLPELVARRNPILSGQDSPEARTAYTVWATAVLKSLTERVDHLHARGVVFGDLHPNNLLVDEDTGEVSFIDFESASAVDADEPQRMGAPGFRAPVTFRGIAVDRYGLGCIRLSMFIPMTIGLAWGSAKLDQLLETVLERFPVGPDFATTVRTDLGEMAIPSAESPALWPVRGLREWPPLRDAWVRTVLDSATTSEDRLYPGDIEQFHSPGGSLGFATGAAGVAWALADLGGALPEEHAAWLLERLDAVPALGPGLFQGWAGVALSLARMGRDDDACSALSRAVSLVSGGRVGGSSASDGGTVEVTVTPERSYAHGLAGVGLALLESDTPDGRRLAESLALAEMLLALPQPDPHSMGYRPGLSFGGSGEALWLARLFERTGNDDFLELAGAAIGRDLDLMGWEASAPPGYPYRWDTMALSMGGPGVALVADTLRPYHDRLPPLLVQRLDRLRVAVRERLRHGFNNHAGLMHGRAGAIYAFGRLEECDRPSAGVMSLVRDVGLHVVPIPSGLGILGDGALRVSTDLATGAIGLLWAIDSALGGGHGLPGFPRVQPDVAVQVTP